MTPESESKKNPLSGKSGEAILEQKNPALTIIFQTWATPIVGIVMLVTGLIGGYYGRDLVLPDTTAAPVKEIDPVISGNSPAAVPTKDEDQAAIQQDVMAALVEETRHFRGDPDAPITIIEFSDFL